MMLQYVIAVVTISGLMIGWALIQQAWGRVFRLSPPETDVLELRRSCGQCGCATPCSRDTQKGQVSIRDESP